MIDSRCAEIVETIYGRFYSEKGDMITEQLKQYSAHTRNELAMLKSFISEGDNIIDIGAHIGTFAIPFARFNMGKGKIFSFEADINNYSLLKINIDENNLGSVIEATHAIISDVKHRFAKLKTRDDNSATYYFLPDDNSTTTDVLVESISIDEWFTSHEYDMKINVIKIDVEGAEMSAICSCNQIITKYHPILYIEINKMALDRFKVSYDNIEDYLKLQGYKFFRNTGERNSNNDMFTISPLNNIEDGGLFFDLLAIHPSDPKYSRII